MRTLMKNELVFVGAGNGSGGSSAPSCPPGTYMQSTTSSDTLTVGADGGGSILSRLAGNVFGGFTVSKTNKKTEANCIPINGGGAGSSSDTGGTIPPSAGSAPGSVMPASPSSSG